jgi:hypothetical protein
MKRTITRAAVAVALAAGMAVAAAPAAQAHSNTELYSYSTSTIPLDVVFSNGQWWRVAPGHSTLEGTRAMTGAQPVRVKRYPGTCIKYRVENSTHSGFGAWQYVPTSATSLSLTAKRKVEARGYRCTG